MAHGDRDRGYSAVAYETAKSEALGAGESLQEDDGGRGQQESAAEPGERVPDATGPVVAADADPTPSDDCSQAADEGEAHAAVPEPASPQVTVRAPQVLYEVRLSLSMYPTQPITVSSPGSVTMGSSEA